MRALLDRGDKVRVLLRPQSNNNALDGLDVERVFGDLRDPGCLGPAVRGVDRVFARIGDSFHARSCGPERMGFVFT